MNKLVRLLGVSLAIAAGLALVVGYKWYSFVGNAKIDKQRGVYADDGLELFIFLNGMMPPPLRAWACKELLTREAYERTLVAAPLTCSPKIDNDKRTIDEALRDNFVEEAVRQARRKHATDVAIDQAKTCVVDTWNAQVKPEMIEALKTKHDAAVSSAVSEIGRSASSSCAGKAIQQSGP